MLLRSYVTYVQVFDLKLTSSSSWCMLCGTRRIWHYYCTSWALTGQTLIDTGRGGNLARDAFWNGEVPESGYR